jgi:predicted ATPase
MKSLRLQNIRCFADSGTVNIAPITLLLGQNSSGKSTFARFFPLVRQTAEVLTREPFLWLGRLVDFGSAEEVFSKFATDNSFGAEFEFEIEKAYLSRRRRIYYMPRSTNPQERSTVIKVGTKYIFKDNKQSSFQFSLSVLGHSITLQVLPDSTVEYLSINGNDLTNAANGNLIVGSWMGSFPALTYKDTNSVLADNNVFARQLRTYVRVHTHGKSGPSRVDSLTRGLINSPLDDLLNSVQSASASDSIWVRTTANWNEYSQEFMRVRDLIVAARLAEIVESAGIVFRRFSTAGRYITPVRASAERYYRQRGLAVSEIDSQGQNVAMFLHNMSSSERQRFADWMASFFGVYVDTQTSLGHISLILKDSSKGKHGFNLADSGFGFSQMLPVLIQIWTAASSRGPGLGNPQIISIEQPELHLHPRLQARLADVMLQAIGAARAQDLDLRLVIESHSEQIVNRIGKLVSQGSLASEDTNVLLFEKPDFSSPTTVTQTKYDSNGMLDHWPYGFFDSDIR